MDKNSICVCTICQNEIEILPYTLPQSIKWADKVIVINGGTELSTDGTTEYLDELQKEYPDKLFIEHGIFGDNTMINNWDKIQRNRYLSYLEQMEWPGFAFLVDSDETFTDEDWLKIKQYVKLANQNDIKMIRFPYINFFGDFQHEIHGPNWDTYSHHLWKYEIGDQYIDQSTLIHDIYYKMKTHYPSNMIMEVNNISLYHYSHAQNTEREKRRIYKYYKRGDLGQEVAKNTPDDINKWDWKDNRLLEMSESKVKPFTGVHPIHMRNYLELHKNDNL